MKVTLSTTFSILSLLHVSAAFTPLKNLPVFGFNFFDVITKESNNNKDKVVKPSPSISLVEQTIEKEAKVQVADLKKVTKSSPTTAATNVAATTTEKDATLKEEVKFDLSQPIGGVADITAKGAVSSKGMPVSNQATTTVATATVKPSSTISKTEQSGKPVNGKVQTLNGTTPPSMPTTSTATIATKPGNIQNQPGVVTKTTGVEVKQNNVNKPTSTVTTSPTTTSIPSTSTTYTTNDRRSNTSIQNREAVKKGYASSEKSYQEFKKRCEEQAKAKLKYYQDNGIPVIQHVHEHVHRHVHEHHHTHVHVHNEEGNEK